MLDLNQFKEKFYTKYPKSELLLLDIFKEGNYTLILVQTKYGLCKIRNSHLLNGVIPNCQSAINKIEYFTNQLLEKRPDTNINIIDIVGKFAIVKTKYGICKVNRSFLLKKENITIQSAINKIDYYKNQFYENYPDSDIDILELIGKKDVSFKINEKIYIRNRFALLKKAKSIEKYINNKIPGESFIEKANYIHNNKYDYTESNYINCKQKVCIICSKHGKFLQSPANHLNGEGCRKCQYDKLSQNHENNYKLNIWKKKGENSKFFNSFKIYIIRCWKDEEEFYKLGRTFLTVKNRFNCIKKMPYNYEIIQEITGEAEEIFNLEIQLKKYMRNYKYKPKINFNGKHECFKSIDINSESSETTVSQWLKVWDKYQEFQK